jgi:hypothetical protein
MERNKKQSIDLKKEQESIYTSDMKKTIQEFDRLEKLIDNAYRCEKHKITSKSK